MKLVSIRVHGCEWDRTCMQVVSNSKPTHPSIVSLEYAITIRKSCFLFRGFDIHLVPICTRCLSSLFIWNVIQLRRKPCSQEPSATSLWILKLECRLNAFSVGPNNDQACPSSRLLWVGGNFSSFSELYQMNELNRKQRDSTRNACLNKMDMSFDKV